MPNIRMNVIDKSDFRLLDIGEWFSVERDSGIVCIKIDDSKGLNVVTKRIFVVSGDFMVYPLPDNNIDITINL